MKQELTVALPGGGVESPRMSRRRALALFGLAGLGAAAQVAMPSSTEASTATRSAPPWFDAADYGARPAPGFDNTAVLQSAVTAAATAGGGIVLIGSGQFEVAGEVALRPGVTLKGIRGATVLLFTGSTRLLRIPTSASYAGLEDLVIDGNNHRAFKDSALVHVEGAAFRIQACRFQWVGGTAILVYTGAGKVADCEFENLRGNAILIDSLQPVRVENSTFRDLDDTAVKAYLATPGHGGHIISGNHFTEIRSTHGDGQSGNAINLYRVNGCIITQNVMADIAFSFVRINSCDSTIVHSNRGVRSGECAIYCEYAFRNSVIANNQVDGALYGIKVVNINDGGRGAIVSGNVLTNIQSYAIKVEGEAVVTGNLIDGAKYGILVGTGKYGLHCLVADNLIKDTRPDGEQRLRCGILVADRITHGMFLSGNVVIGAAQRAYAGYQHPRLEPVRLPAQAFFSGNSPPLASTDRPAKSAFPGMLNLDTDSGVLVGWNGTEWMPLGNIQIGSDGKRYRTRVHNGHLVTELA